MRRHAVVAGIFLAACSHRPPSDFAPDPGLVGHIRSIELAAPAHACPGQGFAVQYTALLDDGTRIPFATRYDKKHPPRLHVVFLDRTSDEASPLEDGGWSPDRDPVTSVRTGFRLHAALKANPSITGTATLAPSYECMRHEFVFSGSDGGTGEAGGDGPPITVHVAIGRSPYYDRLLIAAIDVADAPPFHLLADASAIQPADWLVVTSRGGNGGRGTKGRNGGAGAAGSSGCPAGAGGPGGTGGSGGTGSSGGRGGLITIIAASEEPFLAGVVATHSPGGDGGPGGTGGKGGPGGAGGNGGTDRNGNPCPAGAKGADGADGRDGRRGEDGSRGPEPRILTVPGRDVFGPSVPTDVARLLNR
jgi:hypothetical protein